MSVRNSEMEKLSGRVSPDLTDDNEDHNEWLDGADDSDADAEVEAEAEADDTEIAEARTVFSDNVGDSSVQLDVAQLLAEVEAEASKGVDANGRIRRRLEAIMERKRRHQDLLDFEDYDLDS